MKFFENRRRENIRSLVGQLVEMWQTKGDRVLDEFYSVVFVYVAPFVGKPSTPECSFDLQVHRAYIESGQRSRAARGMSRSERRPYEQA